MVSLLVLTSVIYIITGSVRATPEAPRIVGGSEAEDGQFPYQVSIRLNGSHFCGGAYLNENFVVTAALCVFGVEASIVQVVGGTNSRYGGGLISGVSKIIIHPEFNSKSFKNDIALLKLESPVVFSYNSLKSVPIQASETPEGTTCIVSGWGTVSGSNLPHKLQFVEVPIVSDAKCRDQYMMGMNEITDSMICAGKDGKDACSGDAGGGLVCDGKLVGISVWVYTQVSYFVAWINSKITCGSRKRKIKYKTNPSNWKNE